MRKRKQISFNTLIIQEIQKNSKIHKLDYFLLQDIQIKLSLNYIFYINRRLMKHEILLMYNIYTN
jgi:hypothetical protein